MNAHITHATALRAAGQEQDALTAAREAKRLASTKGDRALLRRIEAFLQG